MVIRDQAIRNQEPVDRAGFWRIEVGGGNYFVGCARLQFASLHQNPIRSGTSSYHSNTNFSLEEVWISMPGPISSSDSKLPTITVKPTPSCDLTIIFTAVELCISGLLQFFHMFYQSNI
jgi:hypothetical protein